MHKETPLSQIYNGLKSLTEWWYIIHCFSL